MNKSTQHLPMIDVSDVTQRFRSGFFLGKKTILHQVNFSIQAGECVGLVGPNGAGKTTLIHLLTGVRSPVQGQVRIKGLEVTRAEARTRLGYLPERPFFPNFLTGERFLLHSAKLAGLPMKGVDSRMNQCLQKVGLKGAERTELMNYSKGMLQRIGIAQAILANPDFLVLDEPMSGLDPEGRKDIRELIAELSSEGKTILFSTHILSDIEALCSRVLMIREGKLVDDGPIAGVIVSDDSRFEVRVVTSRPRLPKIGQTAEKKVAEGFQFKIDGGKELREAMRILLAQEFDVRSITPLHVGLEELFDRTKQSAEPKVKKVVRRSRRAKAEIPSKGNKK